MKNANKTLVSNIASLGVVQIISYIFPLLTIPYISRIIGPDGLGLYNYIAAFITYFVLVVNYGFDFTATRKIASDPRNAKLVSKVYSTVTTSRFLILIVTIFTFILLSFYFSNIKNNFILSGILFINAVSALLTPQYIFQGLQKLSFYSTINVVKGIITTVCIFLFVTDAKHLIIYASIGVFTNLFFSVFWAFYVVFKLKIKFVFVSLKSCLKEIQDSRLVFFSTIIFSFYTTANIIILGVFAPPKIIAYYTTAVSLINIIQSVINVPISSSLYPYIGKAFADGKEIGLEKLKRIVSLVFYFSLSACLFIFIFSPLLVKIIYGSEFENAIICVRILSVLPLLSSLSGVMGVQVMLNLGMDLKFLRITTIAAVCSVIMNFIFSYFYSYVGSSVAYLLTEIFIVIALTISLRNNGITIINLKYFNPLSVIDFVKQIKNKVF